MIEQTWFNTPWYRIELKNIYITNGEALLFGIIILVGIAFLIFFGYMLGKLKKQRGN